MRSIAVTLVAFSILARAQYAPSSRWGAASTIVGNTLYVHGGKEDPYNEFSYTSAPNVNHLFSLDLSSPFLAAAAPWQYLSGSNDSSTSQGPAVAFHTLSPFTSSQFLLFGGDGGPSLPVQTDADSAWTLSILTDSSNTGVAPPEWYPQSTGWASEPMRRTYHSASSSLARGQVWIVGGQRADGSGIGLQETWVFSAPAGSNPSFSRIYSSRSDATPPALVGHASVMLSSGIMFVFGGYSSETMTLAPLSTIWFIDTTSSEPLWQNLTVSGIFPNARRNFAAVALDDGRILIHGGGDAALQTVYDDGWILNLSTNPPSWFHLDGFQAALGPRVDHVAQIFGSIVFFAFGRAANGPADGTLVIYNAQTGSFLPTYTPQASVTTTATFNPSATESLPWYTNSVGQTIQSTIAQTVTRNTGLIPGQTSGVSISHINTAIVPTSSTGTNGTTGESTEEKANVVAIALGSVFGAIAAVVLALLLAYCCLSRGKDRGGGIAGYRRGGDDQSRLINASNATDAEKNIPVAGGWMEYGEGRRKKRFKLPPFLAMIPEAFRRKRSGPGTGEPSHMVAERDRFDMLHDEDARSFGQFYAGHSARTSTSGFPPAGGGRPRYERVGSNLSAGGTLGAIVDTSVRNLHDRRQAQGAIQNYDSDSNSDLDSPKWWEKPPAQSPFLPNEQYHYRDPFDERLEDPPPPALAGLSFGGPTAVGMAVTSMRPLSGHQQEFSLNSISTNSTQSNRDPFSDPSELGLTRPRGITSGSENAQPSTSPDPSFLDPQGGSTGQTSDRASYYFKTSPQPQAVPSPLNSGSIASQRAITPHNLSTDGLGIITSASLNSDSLDSIAPGRPSLGSSNELHSVHNARLGQVTGTGVMATASSLIGSAPATANVRRSDTWWNRFAFSGGSETTPGSSTGGPIAGLAAISRRLSLSRRKSPPPDQGGRMMSLDIRDPNPPPRLEPVVETGMTPDPSPPDQLGREKSTGTAIKGKPFNQAIASVAAHGKSVSSIRTADSEALAKIQGGDLYIVQRMRTASSRGSQSASGSADEFGEDAASGSSHRTQQVIEDQEIVTSPRPVDSDEDNGVIGDHRRKGTLRVVGSLPRSVQSSMSSSTPSSESPVMSLSRSSPPRLSVVLPGSQLKRPSLSTVNSSNSGGSGGSGSNASTSRQSDGTSKQRGSPPESPKPRPRGAGGGGGVAAKIAAFEQRASAHIDTTPLSPTAGASSPPLSPTGRPGAANKAKPKWGLVERPKLVLTNPDRRSGGSWDESPGRRSGSGSRGSHPSSPPAQRGGPSRSGPMSPQ